MPTVHGHATKRSGKSKEYVAWQNMKSRCTNPAATGYQRWGGRGVTICARWLHSFENFLADMGPCPKGKTLDRWPDNNGNYEPGNCRWSTPREQRTNQRPPTVAEHVVVHGTTTEYRLGCKCSLCREAVNSYQREKRRTR